MIETKAKAGQMNYISYEEFDAVIQTTIKEIQLAVENKIDIEFQKIKIRIDEKPQKEDVDKALKTKANLHDTTRRFDILEERIIQSNFELQQFNEGYFSALNKKYA